MTNYKQTMADALEFMYLMREYKLAERELTDDEKKKREEIAQDMDDADFKDRYGDRWKEVKMAVATKQAKKEASKETSGAPEDQYDDEEERQQSEEVDLDEANFEIKNGKLHISKADYAKKPKEYKGKRGGKPTLMALDPKTGSTTSFEVVLEEAALDEAKISATFYEKDGNEIDFSGRISMLTSPQLSLGMTIGYSSAGTSEYDGETVDDSDYNNFILAPIVGYQMTTGSTKVNITGSYLLSISGMNYPKFDGLAMGVEIYY